MRRSRAALAVLVCALVGVLGTAGPATAAPTSTSAGQDELPTGPAHPMARLDQLAVAPRTVSAADQTVTVTGRLTNTSDRAIHDVEVRLQLDRALSGEAQLRKAVGPNPSDGVQALRFQPVADVVQPGQSTAVTVTAPINSGTADALRLPTPGVYPLLVNVNGTPDYGGQSRIAQSSMLLPVLGAKDAPGVPPPGGPAGLTMIWPVLDRPHLMPRENNQVVLADDELATTLAPGGRLYNLVTAVEQQAAAGSALSPGLCFAIDPDLVFTAGEMSNGYVVHTGDRMVPGQGAAAARLWLNKLRGVVQGRCVLSVPFADADLVALSRARITGLLDTAFVHGDAVLTNLLKVQPADPRTVWPTGGAVDQPTLAALTTGPQPAAHTFLLTGAGVAGNPSRTGPIPLTGGNGAVGLTADPVLDAAFGSDLPNQVPAQNVLGALTYRAAFDTGAPRTPVLVLPPRQWSASLDDLTAVLGLLTQLQVGNAVTPLSLPDAVKLPPGPAANVAYPEPAAVGPLAAPRTLPPPLTAKTGHLSAQVDNLERAMSREDKSQVEPDLMVLPVREALLRSMSASWRPDNASANRAADVAGAELDYLLSQVFLASPAGPLNMASADSPIPLTIQNNLPVTMNVVIDIAPTPGLKLGDARMWKIPPNGQRSIRVPGQLVRSGRFAVDAALTTPDGLSLGSPVRLELNSSAYGVTTLIVTISAAALLLLLSGRRIFRRIRASRAGRPDAAGEAAEVEPDGTGGPGTSGENEAGHSIEAPGSDPTADDFPASNGSVQQPAVTAHNKGSDQP